jgi:hypothetical protein
VHGKTTVKQKVYLRYILNSSLIAWHSEGGFDVWAVGLIRNVSTFLVEKLIVKFSFRTTKLSEDNNMKTSLKEVGCDWVD